MRLAGQTGHAKVLMCVGACLSACGTSSMAPSNSVSVDGVSVHVAEAVSVVETRSRRVVVLSDHAGVCNELVASQAQSGARYTTIRVETYDGEVVPGEYGVNTINQPRWAAVSIVTEDCLNGRSERNGVTGNVVIEGVSGHLTGTFDVQLETGE